MKFSITLPRPEGNPDISGFAGFIDLAKAAERLGFDAVSGSDHPFPLVIEGEAGHQTYDPFVLLSYVGSATERIALHFSLLVAPYRNPFLSARMLSTLDFASGGRVIAAVGAGYLRAEFDALGADYEGRTAKVDEMVRTMRAAWTGEPVEYSGSTFRASGNVMLPTPTSKPSPRLWRGGNTDSALRHATMTFDGWAPFEIGDDGSKQTTTSLMSIDTLAPRMQHLAEMLEDSGRSVSFDVCYVRTSRRWLKDRDTIIEHLQQLDSVGVTWLEFNISGSNSSEWIDCIEMFAETARQAGVF